MLFPGKWVDVPGMTLVWEAFSLEGLEKLFSLNAYRKGLPEVVSDDCLMQKLFWMAFVAVFPEFPHGDWPCWNGLITMEGDFISCWVLKNKHEEPNVEVLDMPCAVQLTIREQFRGMVVHLSHFLARLPISLGTAPSTIGLGDMCLGCGEEVPVILVHLTSHLPPLPHVVYQKAIFPGWLRQWQCKMDRLKAPSKWSWDPNLREIWLTNKGGTWKI
ncbi:hypothetical protein BKA83DRAFT_4133147 [Pisolithus microcarpus]|nr:hypothetical protein BKA83DRAFT_4133147 [Pisolithus microcarpus]